MAGPLFCEAGNHIGLFFCRHYLFWGLWGISTLCFGVDQKTPHDLQSNNQNFITYYIAIFASACLDLLLKLIDKEDAHKKPKIVWLIVLGILFCLGTGYLLKENMDREAGLFFPWVLGATFISWIFWYGVHLKDDAFNVTAPLGGNTSKPFTNG